MSVLSVDGLVAGYRRVPVVHGVSFAVSEGEVVAVIGANGAGKTTLLRSISGLNRPLAGRVTLDSRDITGASPARIARLGIAHVPENRRVFPAHPVEDNLRLGGYVRRRDPRQLAHDIEEIYAQFPVLAERRSQRAGSLSGGEQQMLAIGMALVARPRVLMLDEPSLGLAPMVVQSVFETIRNLKDRRMTIILVEQRASLALDVADSALILQLGRVNMQGPAAEVKDDPRVQQAYLGA